MRKTGSKRGSGYDAGPSSAVLDAPEESLVPEAEMRWKGNGPAPAGALQRGYGSDDPNEPVAGYASYDESEYIPRRGNLQMRWRGLPRTLLGRIALGVLAVLLLAGLGMATAVTRRYLLHDPRFVVQSSDDIQIEGARHLTRDQVLNVFGADLQRNIFRVSLAERKADLERLPWVQHATVMRLLPGTLRVKITERTPVAFVRQGTQIGLVDASGVLLDMPQDDAGDPHYSFPVLTGLSSNVPLETRAARIAVYQQFLHDLGSGGSHIADSLSEVDVSDPEDVKALIASGSSDILVHFGSEDFLKRYQEFDQHLPEWKQQYPKLASADMRYEGQIVLEMQDGAGTTQPSGPATVASTSTPPPPAQAAHITAAPVAVKAPAPAKAAKLKLVAATVTPAIGPPTPSPAPRVSAKPAPPAKVIAKKLAAKKTAGHKAAEGRSSANDKIFAALAAAHKAAMAKSAMTKTASNGGVRSAGGATP